MLASAHTLIISTCASKYASFSSAPLALKEETSQGPTAERNCGFHRVFLPSAMPDAILSWSMLEQHL